MKKRKYLSVVSLLTLFLILGSLSMWSGVAVAQTWNTEIVDNGGNVPNQQNDVGMYSSIAVGSSSKLHISYGGLSSGLKYATNTSGLWELKTIDRLGYYTSLAIDSTGNMHISYHDVVDDSLRYATNSSGTWVKQIVDSDGNAGGYSSIALDSSGKVHISYCGGLESNSDLKYATNTSGAWVIQTLDRGKVGWSTSIALDSSDKVHISYNDWLNQDQKYVTNATGTWIIKTLDSSGSTGVCTSIAIDSLDNVHMSYVTISGAGNGSLKYATNALGRWIIENIDSGSGATDTSIALDASGNVHISYSTYRSDITYRNLNYITNTAGTWVKETVTSDENARHTSIALDSLGKVHISYWDYLNRDLKYATNSNSPFGDDDGSMGNEEDVIDIIDGDDSPANDPIPDNPYAEHIGGVTNGDYIRFGGRDWIMLDNLTGYVVLKGYESMTESGCIPECGSFDKGNDQTWGYNGEVASLNEYLNTVFFDKLGDGKDFVDNNGEWLIEEGVKDPSYIWNGKVALLTKTEFKYYQENGPNLTGTSFKAIDFPGVDPNINGNWWLLTPGVGYSEAIPGSVVMFVADGNYITASDADNCRTNRLIRPTLHLKSGLYVAGGDGTSEKPKIVTDNPVQNEAPTADAGPDMTVELESPNGTEVTLNGSGSTDTDSSPGNDNIESFEWYENNTLIGTGETLEYTFPAGDHFVKLVVTDYDGLSDEDEVVIVVEDTTPPNVTVSSSPAELWPPNNKLRDIEVSGGATDLSGEVSLKFFVEDEYGEYEPEFTNFNEVIQLIASRAGNDKDGRLYTIKVIATDSSGNSASASTFVIVPHDQGKKK